MDLVGTININVQKKFLKLWYKKKKLHCKIFLLLNRKAQGAHEEVLARKQIAIPHYTFR
jgi:hypothetical protein